MSIMPGWFALNSSSSNKGNIKQLCCLHLDHVDSGIPQWGLGTMFEGRLCHKNEDSEHISVLDLPELVLEEILGRLPPASLCQMAGVCQDLRRRCRSDHLWKTLLEEKWARVVGPSAFQEWQRQVILTAEQAPPAERPPRIWGWPLSCFWPLKWLNLQNQTPAVPPPDSLMAWYWALESGSFWFPAQVYNREVGIIFYDLYVWSLKCEVGCNSVQRTGIFRCRFWPNVMSVDLPSEISFCPS